MIVQDNALHLVLQLANNNVQAHVVNLAQMDVVRYVGVDVLWDVRVNVPTCARMIVLQVVVAIVVVVVAEVAATPVEVDVVQIVVGLVRELVDTVVLVVV